MLVSVFFYFNDIGESMTGFFPPEILLRNSFVFVAREAWLQVRLRPHSVAEIGTTATLKLQNPACLPIKCMIIVLQVVPLNNFETPYYHCPPPKKKIKIIKLKLAKDPN